MLAEAAQLFAEIGMIGQAAEAFFASEEFVKAGELFEQKGEFMRAIDAYVKVGRWNKVIKCIFNFKDQLLPPERNKLVQKYVPVALEELVPKVLNIQKETNYAEEIMKEVGIQIIKEED